MNKTKLIALSGICSAVAVVCLVLLSYVKWVALMLAVVASVVTCSPMLTGSRRTWYSVIVLAISTGLALLLGANPVYLAPVAIFAMPSAIWKVLCQQKTSLLWKTLKWVGYLVAIAVALVVTGLLAKTMMPTLWQSLVGKQYFWPLLVVLALTCVFAYDVLLNGSIFLVKKALQKSHFAD